MYEGKDYVLSIYGTKLDPNTPFAQQQKRMREHRHPRNTQLEEEIKKILKNEVFKEGFYIYMHKTKPENILGIISRGLEIREEGGELESTMSRVFDSKSEDLESDFNYLFNSIAEGNQYGSDSIIAILPRRYETAIDRKGNFPTVPPKYIMASSNGRNINILHAYRVALENGELGIEEQISTETISKRTSNSGVEDKLKVSKTFEEWKKRMIEMGILKE